MSFDFEIAARTAWMEARGETSEGWQAVCWVVINRLGKGFGKTLADVCLRPLQFSCWNTKDPNRQAVAILKEDDFLLCEIRDYFVSALQAKQSDPTGGATHYFSLSIDPPDWASNATFCGQFGNQKFYKNVK